MQPKTVLAVGEVETRQGVDALKPVVEGLAVHGQLRGGALHVAGPNSIIVLLQKRGYTIEQL